MEKREKKKEELYVCYIGMAIRIRKSESAPISGPRKNP